MDFTKLVSLIDSRRLHFARADKLGDPFEGSWTKRNVADRREFFSDISEGKEKKVEDALRTLSETSRKWSRYNAVSCWHMNDHESAAMWKLYLKSNEGIAIQSTYSRLKKSLIDEETVYLGMVTYIDYDAQAIDPRNALHPFVHKRKSFSHEQEVRALATKWPATDTGLDFDKETIFHGLEIKVDIEELIERIYVSPSAPTWFSELVSKVVSRYGYPFEVVHSKLDEDPVF